MDRELLWTLGREANTMVAIMAAQKRVKAARDDTTDGITDDHLNSAAKSLRAAWRGCAASLADCLTVLIPEHDEEDA